ncbi:MAG: RnfH family protein [Burkholderiales bacterium]|nr:RnfH family protein [Burkholderiales bacterium]
MSAPTIRVEVAYATPEKQYLIGLDVAVDTTAEQAIEQSGILATCTEVNLSTCKIGIFGRACHLSTALREHDRVEIYRPLLADPKDARRSRVAAKRPPRKR